MKDMSQRPDIAIDVHWVSPNELHPNPWNPNQLDADLYEKAVASIQEYGFVDPVTARQNATGYEIIDGEHRVRAAKQLNLRTVPVIVLDVDDDTAQQLTLVLNELHGRPDQQKLSRLLRSLAERHSIDSLLATLPFAREQFLAASTHEPKILPAQIELSKWVERMYRLPRTAADTLDAALSKAKEFEEVSDDWQALEAIAAEYLRQ